MVLSKIPKVERNAMWHLFSGVAKLVNWGAAHYRTNIPNMSTIINQLFDGYRLEGVKVSYTIKDFQLDVTRQHVHLLSAGERLRGLPTEERLRGLPTEERLVGLSREEMAKLKAILEQTLQ